MGSSVDPPFPHRSHTVTFMPNLGQISTFGLASAGRADTKLVSSTAIPQKLPLPFLPYKTMKQVTCPLTLVVELPILRYV